ncbi:lysophosphatidic acid receptor 4-like [Diretmus argenteus]
MAYAIAFGCIMVLGLPLNAVSLWILIRRHSLKSPSAVFMINLALSDLLLVTTLPMRVYFYATGSWPLGIMECMWISMFYRNNIRSSCIFITFIGVDRLLAVVYPLRSRHLRTTSNAWRVSGFIWLFVLAINIPEAIGFSRTLHRCNVTTCFEFPGCQIHYDLAMFIFLAMLVFIMLVVNVVCTAMVSWTLRHLSDSARINNKVNVMLIFALNLLMFIICFLPVSLAGIVKDQRAIMATACLASVNCCLDPLLYYFSLDDFWKKKDHVDSSPAREL